MVPIGLASVVALAALVWRLFALRPSQVSPRALVVELEELIKQDRFADAITLCRKNEAVVVARIIEAAVLIRGRARSVIKERLEEVGRRESAELERGAEVVGVVASISPLMGLLGTVWGMIQTFEVIQSEGVGVIGSLAGGISQALITTMAGLSVAIPAVVAHRWLLSRVDNLTLDLEDASLRVLDLLSEESTGA
jgi:biopolymer transport protein ExbB